MKLIPMMQRYLLAIAALLLAATAGCSDDDAIVQLAVAEFSFRPGGFDGLTVGMQGGARNWVLEPEDFRPPDEAGAFRTSEFRLDAPAVLRLQPVLREGLDTIASAVVGIPLEAGHEYLVTFLRGGEELRSPDGALGTARIEIEPAFRRQADDALWVRWSGRSRSARDLP